MPEWLKQLLTQYNSGGLVDTLQQLTKAKPVYEKLLADNVSGKVYPNKEGKLALGLSRKTIDNYNKDYPTGLFGDHVISHEFGHIAGSGMTNVPLGDSLMKVDKRAYQSENLANTFSDAIQFLRSHSTDTSKLDKKTKRVVDIILTFSPYENHPINRLNKTVAALDSLLVKK